MPCATRPVRPGRLTVKTGFCDPDAYMEARRGVARLVTAMTGTTTERRSPGRPAARVVAALIATTAALAAGPRAASGQETPTFSRDVAPILFQHCASCHRPGQYAPFSVLTYDETRPWARAIRQQVVTRRMPPWKPAPDHGEFRDIRRLSEAEIGTIDRWAEAGAPEGDPAQLPPAPRFPDGWQLGEPDLVLEMPEPYAVPTAGGDILRSFAVPTPLTASRWVRAVEFQPGETGAVHHGRILIDTAGTARLLDAQDPEPGYSGMLYDAADFPDGHFLGWLPGTQPKRAPEGLSWQLPPGRDLVLQLHLLPTGAPETLRARVGLYFDDAPPTRRAFVMRLGSQDIDIPAGERGYVIEDQYTLPIDVDVLSVYPHAHYLATEISAWATLPDGERTWLVDIPEWEFAWQDQYQYAAPLHLPAGTVVSARFVYDNSATNPQNPSHPPRRVTYGSGSADEMADLPLQVVARREEDLPRLVDEMERRERQQHIVGDRKRLEITPDDPVIHDRLATLLIAEERLDEATVHLEEAVRLAPDFALAHYHLGNVHFLERDLGRAVARFERALAAAPRFAPALRGLGTIRRAEGQLAEAVRLFREALAINPDDAETHNTLGGIFQWLGDYGQAIHYFGEAVRSRPGYALAHHNLGFTLALDGRPGEATAHYRRAMALAPEWAAPAGELAWLLATSSDDGLRDPDAAVRLAEEALRLAGATDVAMLDTAAAAYAAAGRYDEAARLAEEALQAAGAAADTAYPEIRDRLRLYRAGQPYRTSRP